MELCEPICHQGTLVPQQLTWTLLTRATNEKMDSTRPGHDPHLLAKETGSINELTADRWDDKMNRHMAR